MQKNFKCQQCGHRFVAEDDISTKCPKCGSDLIQPISVKRVKPWMYAVAFIVFLVIGFGVSELVQPKMFVKAKEQTPSEDLDRTYEEPYTDVNEPTPKEPLTTNPTEPAPTQPASQPPVPSTTPTPPPTSKPVTAPTTTPEPKPTPAKPEPPSTPAPTSEPKPTETMPAPKPSTSAAVAASPKPVTTTPATPTAPAKAASTSTPVAVPTPTPAPTKTSLTAAEAQGILASGKTSSKIPDGTKITVNGQRMDYQGFRQGVNSKAFSNIKVTGVNADGSITVTATSHYED